MHPALIPEKHPMCGKFMEALIKCREDHHLFQRYLGVCNDATYDLTECLVKEKTIARAGRQAKFTEMWKAKRQEDEMRMRQLEEDSRRRILEDEQEYKELGQMGPDGPVKD